MLEEAMEEAAVKRRAVLRAAGLIPLAVALAPLAALAPRYATGGVIKEPVKFWAGCDLARDDLVDIRIFVQDDFTRQLNDITERMVMQGNGKLDLRGVL